ncbi:MAG: ABC transporter substrate-binding protein [Myxococcota bacterium]
MRPPRSLAPFALLLAMAVAAPAAAQGDPSAAQSFIQERTESVRAVLRRPANDARAAALTEQLGGLLDYEELGRRALRDHWDVLQPAQREEFVSILRQLVERSYQQNLESTLEFRIDVEGAEARGSAVVVRTVARSTRNRRLEPVAIDYQVKPNGDEWRVFDIVTDGVSLVRNYRAQFNRILDREGWDGLMGRMRQRLAEG